MSAVTEIDIPNNCLLDIPPAIHYLVQLRRINARDNKITGISFELNVIGACPRGFMLIERDHQSVELGSLNNTISRYLICIWCVICIFLFYLVLPNELSKCKIKSLSLESNPIKDRKLKKLIEQHGATKPKSVIDYLKANVPESKVEPLPKPKSMVLKEMSKAAKYNASIRQGTDWILEVNRLVLNYFKVNQYILL